MPRDGSPNRQRILDAAERLVIENGFNATTLDQVIAACDSRDLAKALWQAPPSIVEIVLANMSERARESLLEEQEVFDSLPADEVATARREVVAVARRLEDEGAIQLSRGDAT